MKDIPLKDRIIFALDVPTPAEAQDWVERLGSHINYFKVGLQLFLAGGMDVIEMITGRGHKVMVDLKFFDIPETVKLAVQQFRDSGASLVTVHGNDPIIRAAIEERGQTKILAVTVLTSFGEEDMRAMGMTQSIEDLVHFRAKRALDLGCDGVVSSGMEAPRLRESLGDKLLIVTPGIRPGANIDTLQADDQKRIVTAKQAISGGADHVVVGRPISKAADPLAVVADLQEEILTATGE